MHCAPVDGPRVCCVGSSRALTGSADRLYAPTPRRQRTRIRSVVALHRPRRQSDEMAGAPVGVGSQVSAAPRGHGMDAAAEAASRRRATPSLSGGLHRPPLSLSMHLSHAMTAARRSAWLSLTPACCNRPARLVSSALRDKQQRTRRVRDARLGRDPRATTEARETLGMDELHASRTREARYRFVRRKRASPRCRDDALGRRPTRQRAGAWSETPAFRCESGSGAGARRAFARPRSRVSQDSSR